MRSRNGLYNLLQVLPDADPAVIEAAYKALMKKFHPDRLGGVDAERRAAEISHAFNVLRDTDRRAAYDVEQRAQDERWIDRPRVLEPTYKPVYSAPVRPEPRPVRANRVAAWTGAAGVAVLAATIILLARGAPEAPASNAPGPVTAAAEDGESDIPFRDQPVSRSHVGKAVAEFMRVARLDGVTGAAEFSERCFEGLAESLDINAFDFCVAFDHAAARADLLPQADPRNAAARRFQPQHQVSRHVRAADPMADTFASIELRLFEIRRAADMAIAETTSPPPADAVPVGPAAATGATRRAPAQNRQARRVARKQPVGQEQDFLERKGGIY